MAPSGRSQAQFKSFMNSDKLEKASRVPSWYRIPTEPMEFPDLIRHFAKKGVSPDVLARFGVEATKETKGFDKSDFSDPDAIFYDTETALNLTYEGKTVATIAYEPHRQDRSALFIRQLQGGRGAQSELQLLRWEVLLICALIQHARTLPGIEELHIPAAETLSWYKFPDTGFSKESREHQKEAERIREGMRIRFNVTPARMGFVWDSEMRARIYRFSDKDGNPHSW